MLDPGPPERGTLDKFFFMRGRNESISLAQYSRETGHHRHKRGRRERHHRDRMSNLGKLSCFQWPPAPLPEEPIFSTMRLNQLLIQTHSIT